MGRRIKAAIIAAALAVGLLAAPTIAHAGPIWYACTDRLGITIYTTSLSTVANYRAWFGYYSCVCVPGPVPR